ncbi:MAG: hypothetical protein M5R40_15740 [Anaerolineae bacterium]|nr:hypothetical protein [Anaerolineae bacterium]
MNDEQFAHRVERTARAFPYPPTPDIAFAPKARQPARRPLRRFAWAAVIVVAVFFGMLAIEPVRAAVLEVLRIGGVEVWIGGAPPTPLPLPTNLLDLAGATTLEAARAAVDFRCACRQTSPAGLCLRAAWAGADGHHGVDRPRRP